MFSVITNIYNKKTKGPTLMEFFTATGKLVIYVCNHGGHYEMPCIICTKAFITYITVTVLGTSPCLHLTNNPLLYSVSLLSRSPSPPLSLSVFTSTIMLSMTHETNLTRVWQQLEYRIDVCRVTPGAHIEHL